MFVLFLMQLLEKLWQPTPVFLPGESHGQRSLAGYSPQSCKESDTKEWLTHTFLEKLKSSVWFTFYCCWTTRAQTSPGSHSDPASLLRTHWRDQHSVNPARPEVHQQPQKVRQASLSGRSTLHRPPGPASGRALLPSAGNSSIRSLRASPGRPEPLLPTSPATLGSDAAPPLSTAPSLAFCLQE